MKKFRNNHGYDVLTDYTAFLPERRQIATLGKDVYISLCEEFGVTPEEIQYEFFCNTDLTSSAGFCYRDISTWKLIVGISIGHFKVVYAHTVNDTLPHEIAHAFLRTVYPGWNIGHSAEWVDVMEFMGLKPEIFVSFYSDVNLQIDQYENSL